MAIHNKSIGRVSIHGLFVVFMYVMIGLIFRLVLPVGDEPDFEVRVREILSRDYPIYFPYHYIGYFIEQLKYLVNCKMDSLPLTLIGSVDYSSCGETVDNLISRQLITLFVMSPVLLMIVFKGTALAALQHLTIKKTKYLWNRRIDSVALTLLFPASFYYFGLLSLEQFFLVSSLFLFVFWGTWVTPMILFILASIDLGNFVIVVSYILMVFLMSTVQKIFGWRTVFAITFVLMMSAYLIGHSILEYFKFIPLLTDKVDLIISSYSKHASLDKYPVFLRPGITFMSFVFYTAENLKVVILYICYMAVLVFSLMKIVRKHRKVNYYDKNQSGGVIVYEFNKTVILSYSGLVLIFILTFIFPTYANAKYFYFLMPFFINTLLNVYQVSQVLLFSFVATLVTLGHLSIYLL